MITTRHKTPLLMSEAAHTVASQGHIHSPKSVCGVAYSDATSRYIMPAWCDLCYRCSPDDFRAVAHRLVAPCSKIYSLAVLLSAERLASQRPIESCKVAIHRIITADQRTDMWHVASGKNSAASFDSPLSAIFRSTLWSSPVPCHTVLGGSESLPKAC